jgi:hypothetical protein
MGGAYRAKPAIVVSPDAPPGWEWPFPGPFPPGYEPVMALALTSPTEISPSSASGTVTASLSDHATYPTSQPTGNLTWTATWSDTGDEVPISITEE